MFKLAALFLVSFSTSIFAAQAPSASKMKNVSDNEVVMRCLYCGASMIDYDPVTYKQCYHLLNGQKFFPSIMCMGTRAKVAEAARKMSEKNPKTMEALCAQSFAQS